MALKFLGEAIKCGSLHAPIYHQPAEVVLHRTFYWGLTGMSEILGGVGAGRIEATAWLNQNDWTGTAGYVSLANYLRELDGKRGRHGPVEEVRAIPGSGNVTINYPECTFEGVFRIAVAGQESPKPCQLVHNNSWAQPVVLIWTTLRDEFTVA